MASIEIGTFSDDDTHLKATNLRRIVRLVHESSEEFGKSFKTVATWKEKMIKAGFEDVHEKVFKLPQSPWPKDPKLKEIGRYHQLNVLEGLGPYTYALFTRVLGWSRAEIEVILASARNEVKDLSIHLYTRLWIVYGRKPEKSA